MIGLFSRTIKFAIWIIILAAVFGGVANWYIVQQNQTKVIRNIEQVPAKRVGLVLGTSKRTVQGGSNPYFMARIEAASQLFKQGKVQHLIVSGDNTTQYYNEPEDMRKALVALGIPNKAITLDYAGFRTLDSIVRCKEVFGQDSVIIVTQRFHAYRALFLSRFYNIEAHAFEAPMPYTTQQAANVLLREALARPKAVIDLYLLNKAPRFLGEKVQVP